MRNFCPAALVFVCGPALAMSACAGEREIPDWGGMGGAGGTPPATLDAASTTGGTSSAVATGGRAEGPLNEGASGALTDRGPADTAGAGQGTPVTGGGGGGGKGAGTGGSSASDATSSAGEPDTSTTDDESDQGEGSGGTRPTASDTGDAEPTCVPGVQTGDDCEPAVDTSECVRSDRTCECGSDGKWSCASDDAEGSDGTGGNATDETGGSGGRSTGGSGGTGAGGLGSAATGGAVDTGTDTGGASGPAIPKFVGNITAHNQVPADFANYWDQITPENEGKWGSVEPSRGNKNWATVDRIYDYAQQHGIIFKQHTFVWGSQQPSWVSSKSDVEDWISAFCARYPETKLIDVVNEPPPHTTPPYLQALGGGDVAWIVEAFKIARQYCGDAVLIINDYNNIEWDSDASHFRGLVQKALEQGAPIDAIGAQSHDCYKQWKPALLEQLEAIGLPVYITEYDIPEASDARQKQIMEQQFPVFWEDDNIKGITIWGYVDNSTWKANSDLMNGSTQREAMRWLMEFLGR